MRLTKLLAAGLSALLLATGPAAMAWAKEARFEQTSQEAADEKAVMAALTAMGRGGFPELGKHVPALRQVLDRAPARYPLIETRGDVTVMRSDDAVLGNTLVAALTGARPGRQTSVVQGFNTYPMAALVLASHAVEMGRPQEAITYLDKGLALQPESHFLNSEKAAALSQLGRDAEAVDLLSRWLETSPASDPANRARVLRSKGFSLINLDRLDEAEAAYRESLELAPNHGLALSQLKYIAELRAGGPRRKGGLTTADKAAEPE